MLRQPHCPHLRMRMLSRIPFACALCVAAGVDRASIALGGGQGRQSAKRAEAGSSVTARCSPSNDAQLLLRLLYAGQAGGCMTP